MQPAPHFFVFAAEQMKSQPVPLQTGVPPAGAMQMRHCAPHIAIDELSTHVPAQRCCVLVHAPAVPAAPEVPAAPPAPPVAPAVPVAPATPEAPAALPATPPASAPAAPVPAAPAVPAPPSAPTLRPPAPPAAPPAPLDDGRSRPPSAGPFPSWPPSGPSWTEPHAEKTPIESPTIPNATRRPGGIKRLRISCARDGLQAHTLDAPTSERNKSSGAVRSTAKIHEYESPDRPRSQVDLGPSVYSASMTSSLPPEGGGWPSPDGGASPGPAEAAPAAL
jgi:hypothetical protein